MTPAEHNAAQQATLKSYLDRELPPWRRLAVRLHLSRCAACREEMRAMQQIAEELRVQTVIDPLDPNLRSRILATVQEMPPLAVPHRQARRPALVWSTAVAALLLIALFAPRFRSTDSLKASSDSSQSREQAAFGSAANKSAVGSGTVTVFSPSRSQAGVQGSLAAPGSMAPTPQKQEGNGAYSRAKSTAVLPPNGQYDAGSAVSDREAPPLAGGGIAAKGRTLRSMAPAGQSASERSLAYNAVSSFSGGTHGVASSAGRRPEPSRPRSEGRLASSPRHSIPLERAGFDANGYRFTARDGRRIDVPFKKSLAVVRFARAADGKMTLMEGPASPILYLAPGDVLRNDAVPGSSWQPLPAGSPANAPLYVLPASGLDHLLAMRWYPNMKVVGGRTYSASGQIAFLLPGSHIEIAGVVYPDDAAYRAYADAHPNAFRLHGVYEIPPAPTSTTPAAKHAKSARHAVGPPRP